MSFEDAALTQEDEQIDDRTMSYDCWELRRIIHDEDATLEERDNAAAELEQIAHQGDPHAQCIMGLSRTQTDATEHTIRDFLTNVAKYDTVEDFSRNVLHNMQRTSSRNGILKAEACREIALVCRKHGINTLRDFNDYTDKAALDKDIKSVRGQSSGIMLKYLYMLAGDENRVKPDRHIVRFIKETCALQKLTDDDVQAIMVRAVEMLKPEYPNITVRFLDSLIWEAQRQ